MQLKDIDISDYDTLFLDRDGVINKLRPNDYVKKWDEFEFIPEVLDMFALWAKHFKHIVIVTNQRGVGKGLMSEDDLNNIHRQMVSEIEKRGGRVDKIYYCTEMDNHHPNRKPNIGMGLQALKDFPEIDLKKSIMFGDSASDMLFASNLGIKGVMV